MGGKYLVITATFPGFIKKKLNAPVHGHIPRLVKHNVKVKEVISNDKPHVLVSTQVIEVSLATGI